MTNLSQQTDERLRTSYTNGAGRMECAANAAMTAPDKINDDLLVKYRKLIALLDEHEMLDKL
jgi:hypothetical protein